MKLLHNQVLLQPDKPAMQTLTGIYLSSGNNIKELPPFGRVMAVAKGITDIAVDDRVVFSPYAGLEVDEDTVLVPYDAIMGIVE